MASDEGFFSRWSRRKVQAVREPAGAAEVLQPDEVPQALSKTARVNGTGLAAPADALAAQPVTTAADAAEPAAPAPSPATAGASPPPTLDEARALMPDDDFRRFVTPQVDPQVRNTALKRLFADPHFNVMDRLDVYIDDYGKPDPLPPGMLRQLAQSAALGLFADEPAQPAGARAAASAAAPAPVASTTTAASIDDPPPVLRDTAAPAPASPEANAARPPEGPADEDPDLRLQPHDAAGRSGDRSHAGGDPGCQH